MPTMILFKCYLCVISYYTWYRSENKEKQYHFLSAVCKVARMKRGQKFIKFINRLLKFLAEQVIAKRRSQNDKGSRWIKMWIPTLWDFLA